jgi:CheY-like chemotaxis protein
MKIVVADDNEDIALSLAMFLQLAGHDVWTAANGREALEIAERHLPDVMVLDIAMPELDGYKTAQLARLRPWAHALQLYAVSGFGQAKDKERARQAGFDHHLTKPVDPQDIERLIATAPPVSRRPACAQQIANG